MIWELLITHLRNQIFTSYRFDVMKSVEEPAKKKEDTDESLNDQENGPEMIIQVKN